MTATTTARSSGEAGTPPLPAGVLAVWHCLPGHVAHRLTALPAERPREEVGVLWIDVDPAASAGELLEGLAPVVGTITEHDLADLLERDELAKTLDSPSGYRNASFVGFAVEPPAAVSDQVGDLLVQMVEVLVGPGVLLSCWQQSSQFRGATSIGDEAPALRDEVVSDVVDSWHDEECETAADLATALMESVLRHSRATVCDLEHWLQVWELGYHSDRADAGPDSLKRLLAMVNESRRRLTAFDNARLAGSARRFESTVARRLADRVEHLTNASLKRHNVLLDSIRADMELVSMDKMARQAEMAEERAQRDEVFQGRLEKVTALLLVPTLIAGIFGANTALPGGGTWIGFDAMLVLMVATSVAVYLFLNHKKRQRDEAAAAASKA